MYIFSFPLLSNEVTTGYEDLAYLVHSHVHCDNWLGIATIPMMSFSKFDDINHESTSNFFLLS